MKRKPEDYEEVSPKAEFLIDYIQFRAGLVSAGLKEFQGEEAFETPEVIASLYAAWRIARLEIVIEEALASKEIQDL